MGYIHHLLLSVVMMLLASVFISAEDYKYSSQFHDDFSDMATGDDIDQYLNGGKTIDLADDSIIHNNKRIPNFSVNGGLRSLTDMLYSRERANLASGRSGIRNKLLKLGKRDWQDIGMLPVASADDDMNANPADSEQMMKRRTRQLSVSGPLSALANILAAEGRRRQFTESRHNRMRLLELGKRSDDLAMLSKSVGQYSDSAERDNMFE